MIDSLIFKTILTKDEKGRSILYFKSKDLAYLLQQKDLKKYNLYKNRYILVLGAIALLTSFNINILYSILAGILSILLLEYNYRNRFLKSLSKVTKFKYTDEKNKTIISKKDNDKNLILSILYLLFGILFLTNSIINKSDIYLMLFSIIVLISCIIISAIKLKDFLNNKKLIN